MLPKECISQGESYLHIGGIGRFNSGKSYAVEMVCGNDLGRQEKKSQHRQWSVKNKA